MKKGEEAQGLLITTFMLFMSFMVMLASCLARVGLESLLHSV